jgi:hypothetical protein
MSKTNNIFTKWVFVGLIAGAIATPTIGNAQSIPHWFNRQLRINDQHHPQSYYRYHDWDKNDWRSLSYIGGGVAVAGILSGSPELTTLGIVGGLYSTYRYDEDRRSGEPEDRARYEYFSRRERVIDGRPCHRVTILTGGHHYYAYRPD